MPSASVSIYFRRRKYGDIGGIESACAAFWPRSNCFKKMQFRCVAIAILLEWLPHIEARSAGSEVIIGNGVVINNNAVIIAEKTFIKIGDDTLIGSEFNVYDSDFHGLHPDHRNSGNHLSAGVSIGENVFIGSRVTVLKGVAIGNNSVIANGSIVNMDVPANVIAGGVPIRIIREI